MHAKPSTPRTGAPGAPGARRRTMLDRLLAIPLVGKLVGANALILLAAVAVLARNGWGGAEGALMVAALVATFAINVLLVWVALRPLSGLEVMAERIQRGDLEARVPSSRIADRDLARIGETLNGLVDRLTGDRARMRALAAQVIEAQDAERARVARELHDSTAQTLAAVLLQLRALSTAITDPAVRPRLELVRDTVVEALEDVRTMAHTMYPRILDDLGLGAALERLASRAQDASGITVQVERADDGRVVPPPIGSVLYRVAQEALHNAVTHSGATEIALRVAIADRTAAVEIEDNGKGFEPEEGERRRAGMGLFAMRERAGLVGGEFEVESRIGLGTRVSVVVPLDS